jgi:hypothetical protein
MMYILVVKKYHFRRVFKVLFSVFDMRKGLLSLLLVFVFVFGISMASAVVAITPCENVDITEDGSVDLADFVVLRARFGDVGCNDTNNYCDRADINRDGAVDGLDLNEYTSGFGQICFVPAPIISCNDTDITEDGSVGLEDFVVLRARFGDVGCNDTNNYCDRADINRDGAVDGLDLNEYTSGFGQICFVPAPAPAPAPAPVPENPNATCSDSDMNIDGSVDLVDFTIFRSILNSNDTTNCSVNNDYCNHGDINRDGVVTMDDYSFILGNFGMTCSADIVIDLISPVNGSSVKSDSYDMFFEFNATGNYDLSVCGLYLNDKSVVNVTNLDNTINFTTSGLVPATYSWYVMCVDNNMNTNLSELLYFFVNAVPDVAPASSNRPSSAGGATCGTWGDCIDGIESRKCGTATVVRDCAVVESDEVSSNETNFTSADAEEDESGNGFFSLITGAVTGVGTVGSWLIVALFVILAIVAFVAVKKRKSKK